MNCEDKSDTFVNRIEEKPMFGHTIDTIHSLFVHFPIALFSTGWFCDVLGIRYRQESLLNAGWWCLVFGVISSVFTIITGFLADTVVGHMSEPFPLIETHGVVQMIAVALFSGLFIWRFRLKSELPEKPSLFVYLTIGGIAVLFLFYGGHLGAQLAGQI